ncbi:MAG: metalloregulator ArsR/SmtB family transcription factor [Pseudomonadota bacterium]
MVKYESASLDHTFAALADPTRRAILARLTSGEATVGELAAPFEMSWPAVTKHLKSLERAGLIERRRDGRSHLCRLQPAPLVDAAQWISDTKKFWESNLDSLERYLKEQTQKGEPKP